MNPRPLVNDFSGGEVSPRLSGRVDLGIYQKSAQELTNWFPRALGGGSKRAGTSFILNTRSNAAARLIPWTINSTLNFMVELTAGHIRFLCADALVTDSTPATVDIATSYTAADLWEIKYAQTKNELYLVHPDYAPIYIRYVSGTPTTVVMECSTSDQSFAGNAASWTAPTAAADLPWTTDELWENVVNWLVPNKSYTASGTFNSKTCSSVVKSGLSLIITFSDASTLTLTRGTTYSYQGTITADLRPFIGSGNYPACAFFFGGRLWMGGSTNDPETLWGSKLWDYRNFCLFESVEYEASRETANTTSDHTATTAKGSTSISSISPAVTSGALVGKYVTCPGCAYGTQVVSNTTNAAVVNLASIADGSSQEIHFSDWKDYSIKEYEDVTEETPQVSAESAVRLRLSTEENERILWIACKDNIYLGTTSSEWVVAGGSDATQIRVELVSRCGSYDIQARFVANAVVYVSASSRHVRQLDEAGTSLTSQADHMVSVGITQMDFQQAPEIALWCVLSDGTVARCLFEPSLGVMAWMRLEARSGDLVESVCVVPGADRDYVYFVVKRTINGSTARFIEKMQENDDEDLDGQWYLDAAVKKTGAAFTTISGLTHLASQEISVRRGTSIADATVETVTVSSGGVATISSSTWALAGLSYQTRLRLHRIDYTETEGLTKAFASVFFRLYRCASFTLRRSEDTTVAAVPVNLSSQCYTGPFEATTDFGQTTEAELVIDSDDPVPLGIQTIVPELSVGDA